MADESTATLAIFKHYFKLGLKANEVSLRIQVVKQNGNLLIVQNWLEYFKSDELTLETKIRCKQAFDWLVGSYGISTFVGYLMPNPFLSKYSILFQPIQFSTSTKFVKNISISRYSV